MKKCLPITLLVSLLCFGAGCDATPTSSSTGASSSNAPTSSTTSSTSAPVSSPITSTGNHESSLPGSVSTSTIQSSTVEQIVVTSVSIEYDGETTVLAGTTAKLSANVESTGSGKVTWSSSNEDVAKVVNGSVSFRNVAADTEVTITATSREDETKSASITFTVKYSAINFANSRGNYDNSLFLDEGVVEVEKGDSALLFNGVYGTKWYVEAEVTPLDLGSEGDQYPKFGIMTGDSADGMWNYECKNLFYFVDAQNPATTNSWTGLGFVGQNDEHSDWNWGSNSAASVAGTNAFRKGEPTKMGLLRDGCNYYLYAGVGEGYGVVKHVVNTHFAADEATYAWFGGWVTSYSLANVVVKVGNEVDSQYKDPTSLTLGQYSQTLYLGDTYQIDYQLDSNIYNPSKLTFTSSDETVATVSNTGLVTAGTTKGSATITVAYGDLKADFTVDVTDDAMFRVVLDGKMDDLLWTEEVKSNYLSHNNPEGTVKIDLYASKNSRGIYFYADYQTKVDHTGAGNWWEGDNIELRLNNQAGLLPNDSEPEGNKYQYWVSRYGVGAASNMNGQYITAPALNEETGYYELSFEFFVDYKKAGITADDLVGFTIGANPGGSGWYAGRDFATGDFAKTNKISSRGITRYLAEEDCPVEGHEYESRITKPVTCVDDGETTYTCKWCGHTYTEPIPAVGEHNYNEEVVPVTPSTCSTHGVGHQGCSGCDDYTEVELPFDYHNHSAWDATASSCSGCGSVLEQGYAPALTETISVERYGAGGWADVSTWTYLARDLEGDFVLKVDYAAQVNIGIAPEWWEGVLPIVQDSLPVGNGSPWVTRLDWWGWVDPWDTGVKFGSFAADADHRNENWCGADGFDNVHKNYTCEWTITRTGNTIRHDFAITAVEGDIAGNTYNYWAILNDVDTARKVNIAMISEFANYQVTAVRAA